MLLVFRLCYREGLTQVYTVRTASYYVDIFTFLTTTGTVIYYSLFICLLFIYKLK